MLLFLLSSEIILELLCSHLVSLSALDDQLVIIQSLQRLVCIIKVKEKNKWYICMFSVGVVFKHVPFVLLKIL